MLELRPCCENCGADLAHNSIDAMICSFECTFCLKCVTEILANVSPNCGGAFEKRPIRPDNLLLKFPPSINSIYKPITNNAYVNAFSSNKF
ncbi:MAG: hypothetical protein JWO06_3222 [Bacteroidota bacterium]|nr:hypothetical protein [Bacteroidota bacterium]